MDLKDQSTSDPASPQDEADTTKDDTNKTETTTNGEDKKSKNEASCFFSLYFARYHAIVTSLIDPMASKTLPSKKSQKIFVKRKSGEKKVW